MRTTNRTKNLLMTIKFKSTSKYNILGILMHVFHMKNVDDVRTTASVFCNFSVLNLTLWAYNFSEEGIWTKICS